MSTDQPTFTMFSAIVDLESTDGRSHSIIVVLPTEVASAEEAVTVAERLALEQLPDEHNWNITWKVADSRLASQTLLPVLQPILDTVSRINSHQ